MQGDSEHWNEVYETRDPERVSWYAPALRASLELVDGLQLSAGARVIDVGGGASSLPRDLLARGLRPTVLDLSSRALEVARARMGEDAERVEWLVGDVTRVELPEGRFELWHDRAVFHFLTEAEGRRRYVDAAHRALAPGGHLVVATFGPEGRLRCSGLETVRYSAESLQAELGARFEPLTHRYEVHTTPAAAAQQFLYLLCRRV